MNARRRPGASRIGAAKIAAAVAIALGLGTLTACSTTGAAAGGTGKFDVVTSFYPMAFLAERIGGDHVHVTSLTSPARSRTTWSSARCRSPASRTPTRSCT